MKPDYTLVRDALPLERLSCARIRQWLAEDAALGSWSRTQSGAIRPQQLAILIRDRIWEAHDVTLATVRQRLQRGDPGEQPRQADYWVQIEIEKSPSEETKLVTRTRFSFTPTGRICAEIFLGERRITDGVVPLRRRNAG